MSDSDVVNSSFEEQPKETVETPMQAENVIMEDIQLPSLPAQEDKTVEDVGDTVSEPTKTEEKKSQIDQVDTDSEQTTIDKTEQKLSKELKALLELSKEANLDTNITYKRKSLDPNMSPGRDPKRSMRSQNPDFLVKQQHFLSRVSHGGASDSEEKSEKEENKKKRTDSSSELMIGGAIDAKSKKLLKPAMALIQNNKDGFCWRCHKDGVNVSCETCPRSYHQKCLRHVTNNSEHWICPDCVCILKAESTKTRSPAMKDMSLTQLCTLLKYAHKRMVQCNDSEPFIHPVSESEFPDYKKYIVHPMDLTKLEENIKCNSYGSTNAFEADAKWMLHNSIIFNSYQSKLTTVAKAIIKICKQEMGEIQNCSTCYLNANTKKEWFVEVCPKPHLLVWAKLKGFPYWPAKVMSSNPQGMVDVRFFGAHDRAWVPYRECFLFTKKDPNSNNQKKQEINECIKELDQYIDNLQRVYGTVNFPPYRTPYEPDRELAQLRMFLPTYKPNGKKGDDGSNAFSPYKPRRLTHDSDEDEDEEVCRFDSGRGRARSRSRARSLSRARSSSQNAKSIKGSAPASPVTPKENAESIGPTPKRMSRRNSTYSAISDSSRQSTSSDKPSKPEDDHTVSDSSMDSTEHGKKTPNVIKISDKLIQKLSNSDKEKRTERETFEGETLENETLERETFENETQPSLNDIKQVILGDSVMAKSGQEGTTKENTLNKENKDINNTSKENGDDKAGTDIRKSGDKPMDTGDDLLEEMYSVNVIDDHQVNGTTNKTSNKRKRSPAITPVDDTTHIQKKLVRLVDINVIKNPKGVVPEKPEVEQPSVSIIQTAPEVVQIKSEPTSPDPESDENAKREYLTALNIIEKPLESFKPTQRARKSFPKPVLNLRAIAAKTQRSNQSQTPPRRDLNQTPNLTQTPKQKPQTFAAKKNGTDSTTNNLVLVAPPPKHVNNVFPPNQTINYTGTMTNPIFNMVTHATGSTTYLVAAPSIPGIPKTITTAEESQKKQSQATAVASKQVTSTTTNQTKITTTVTQTKASVTQTKVSVTQTKALVTQTKASVTQTKASVVVGSQVKSGQAGSSNVFKPAQTSAFSSVLSTSSTVTSKALQSTTAPATFRPIQTATVTSSFKPMQFSVNVQPSQGGGGTSNPAPRKAVAIVSSSAAIPPLCSLSTGSTTNTVANNTHLNALLGSTAQPTVRAAATEPEDFPFFTGPSERLLKALTDATTTKQPPALTPRPPGPLTANTDAGLPSSTGPVTAKVNGISHKLTDYFRGMLVELLTEFGTSDNPEAELASLKLENERLKVQHQQEVSELKKNLQTVLKEVEKNYSEESKRLIEENRAQCETEAIRRVDEAKEKQWCANCKKEAQFYCCWNTSYCDYPCQTDHWPMHMDKCTQNAPKNDNGASGSPKQLPRKNGPAKAAPGSSLLVKSPMAGGSANLTNKQSTNKQPGTAPKVYSRLVPTQK